MNRTVVILIAALACTSSAGLRAQSFAAKSNEDPVLQRVGSSSSLEFGMAQDDPTLERVDESSKALKPVGGDKLLPVQVHSMNQTAGGTFIQLNFGTVAPAATMVCLSKSFIESAPSNGGGWTVSGNVERFAFTATDIQHTVTFKDLDPGHLYFIVILLDPPPEYEIPGTLPYDTYEVTLNRHVTVSIPYIHMIDDSDDLSAGDLAFVFQIGAPSADFWNPGNSWDHVKLPFAGAYQIDSGDGIWPGIGMHATNADQVRLTASCVDHDSMWGGTFVPPDEYMGTGSNSYAEWNSGAWTFNVDGGTEMSLGATMFDREEFEFDFVKTVYDNESTCLEYHVWGVITVTYY